MTAPLKQLPVNGEDCVELRKIGDHVSVGSVPKPVLGSPCRKKLGGKSVGGLRRLSTISEQEADKLDSNPTSHRSWGGSEWTGSSFSVCSDKFRNSGGRFSSDDSFQSDAGDDCAAVILACLHCRFHEMMVLLPGTCERAVSRCFPSYRYIKSSSQRDQQEKDCCSYKLELDCNCRGSCQETGELIELAMEISEVCYR